MTPKEKAKELVNKYSPYVYCYMGSGMLSNSYDDTVIIMNAKQCALIAVYEMLNDCDPSSPFEIERINFWENVKNEIEKL
jgi:hypothetical protein